MDCGIESMTEKADFDKNSIVRNRGASRERSVDTHWHARLVRLAIVTGIVWSLILLGSMILRIHQNYSEAKYLALAEARFHLATGQTARAWMFTLPDGDTLLNADTVLPTKQFIGLRGIDPSGRDRVNDHAMLRGTGSTPGEWQSLPDSIVFPPGELDLPDSWETSALQSLQSGATEIVTYANVNGQKVLRLMRPITPADGCMNCHARDGLRADEVLGGVGVAVPAQPFLDAARQSSLEAIYARVILWLLGLGGLFWAYRAIDARERRNREDFKALARSELRLSLALSGAELGIWDWDITNGTVVYDERWAGMLGYTTAELEPTLAAWKCLVHPEDLAAVMEAVRAHLEGVTPQYETEHRLRHKSGHWVWILDRGRVIEWDAEGKPLRACGTHLNITQRKEAEQALLDEMFRRSILLEQSKDGIVILDAEAGVYEANTSFAEMLGYSIPEILALHAWDWDVGKNRDEVLAMTKSVDANGYHFETIFRQKDGTKFDVEIKTNGAVCGGKKLMFCVCRDVSKRKQAEAKLAVSHSLLRATLESTADGILVVNRQGNVASLNRRFVEMWQIPPHIAEGGDDRLLLGHVIGQLEQPEEFLAKVKHLYEDPDAESFDVLRFKDGRVYERYSTPQRLENEIVGRVWSFRDVTSRVRAEEERELLRDQYFQAQKMEAIGQLAGGVAHDFNNLLQIMQGYTEYAVEESKGDNRLQSSLAHVTTAIGRAKGLVSQLLTFSRRKTLSTERLELDTVLTQLLKMVGRLIGEHIELVFKPNAAKCMIQADRGLIEQIVLNLCVNARDAMAKGGVLMIETECTQLIDESLDSGISGQYVRMTISDTGCGMDEETRKHIFEPFFTTKELGKGTGLGLSSAFGAVKQHNGFIRVHSQVGVGSRFEIFFPINHKDVTNQASDGLAQSDGGRETILVAEDDEVLRKLTERILTKAGYSVLLAKDGEEALLIFRKKHECIDLLLLDLMMPKVGGHEVYLEARQIKPGVPTLFASGYSKEAFEMNLGEAEAAALIQKPYRREQLLQTIREVLSRATSAAPRAPLNAPPESTPAGM